MTLSLAALSGRGRPRSQCSRRVSFLSTKALDSLQRGLFRDPTDENLLVGLCETLVWQVQHQLLDLDTDFAAGYSMEGNANQHVSVA